MGVTYAERFRDPSLAKDLVTAIHRECTTPLRLMEVCGTHTMAIFRHGIRNMLPDALTLMSGPGCPVCVTAQKDIDAFVALSRQPDMIVTTFGDLMRVPGSGTTLARQRGRADVRMVYSVFDAVAIAQNTRNSRWCSVRWDLKPPSPPLRRPCSWRRSRGWTIFPFMRPTS